MSLTIAEVNDDQNRTACFLSVPGDCLSGAAFTSSSGQVIVYNWGEYIDPETIEMFEEETGIEVVYDEFETNEIMYPKVESGASSYDVVCPSDYMISKMIANDMLAELNFDNIPNAKCYLLCRLLYAVNNGGCKR